MLAGYKKIAKPIFWGGFLFIICFVILGHWIYSDLKLAQQESQLADLFPQFEKYAKPIKLESIRFIDATSQDIELTHIQGDNWLVLNVWATWCAPCVKELPQLQALRDIFREGHVKVIAVSVDLNKDPKDVTAFLKRHDIGDVANYLDFYGDIQKKLPLTAMPATFIISPDRKIHYRILGAGPWDHQSVSAFFENL